MPSPELLARLRTLIQERQIGSGIALLQSHVAEFATLRPREQGSGVALGCLAQWMDVGFDDGGLLVRLLPEFERCDRAALALGDYVHLRLAEGLVAMRRENLSDSLRHFETALVLGEDLGEPRITAVAILWKARCLRKAGEYDQAEEITRRGIDLASRANLPYIAAVIRTLESWLLFQKGETAESLKILTEAEAVLSDTDDFITLGNIQSTYGRIALREGRYDHALKYFERSISLFERRQSLGGYLARSLTNIAQSKRFLALQLRRNIDARWERQRALGAPRTLADGNDKAGQLERMHDLLRNAQTDLSQADVIYKRLGNHHGAGNVAVNQAQIQLDLGNLDEAEERAAEAFQLGAAKADYVLMCRARIVQAMTAHARYEEDISDEEDPSRFAQLAHDCAKEAVAFGQRTESRRLLAQAYICQGLTFVSGFFHNIEAARACCDRAESFLDGDRHDALWQEIELLRAKILHAGVEDPNLRAWSEGSIGDKSLGDVVAEFEELLIRRVWEREGRKVSRVAHKLAVSPKKIRRVLRHLGLLAEQSPEDLVS